MGAKRRRTLPDTTKAGEETGKKREHYERRNDADRQLEKTVMFDRGIVLSGVLLLLRLCIIHACVAMGVRRRYVRKNVMSLFSVKVS